MNVFLECFIRCRESLSERNASRRIDDRARDKRHININVILYIYINVTIVRIQSNGAAVNVVKEWFYFSHIELFIKINHRG